MNRFTSSGSAVFTLHGKLKALAYCFDRRFYEDALGHLADLTAWVQARTPHDLIEGDLATIDEDVITELGRLVRSSSSLEVVP